MKLALEKKKTQPNQLHWKACLPFVENKRGVLIHRPRNATTYTIHRLPHIGIGFWCGSAVTGKSDKFDFLSAPPEGRILCERCEAYAVANGLPSADELAGRHVHKGRTVAVVTCCDNAEGGA